MPGPSSQACHEARPLPLRPPLIALQCDYPRANTPGRLQLRRQPAVPVPGEYPRAIAVAATASCPCPCTAQAPSPLARSWRRNARLQPSLGLLACRPPDKSRDPALKGSCHEGLQGAYPSLVGRGAGELPRALPVSGFPRGGTARNHG